MRAYLIDPPNQSVTEVEHNDDYQQIYEYINASTFTCVLINLHGDVVYVDDEGLINGNSDGWFGLDSYGQPLKGKGLVLGSDTKGNSIDPTITLEDLRKRVTFYESVDANSIDKTVRVSAL